MYNYKIYKETLPINIPPDDNEELRLDQTIRINILNFTKGKFALIQKDLYWGRWDREPTEIISANSSGSCISRGTIFGGIEGSVVYFIPGGGLKVYWTFSNWDKGYAEVTLIDPNHLYNIFLDAIIESTATVRVSPK